MAEAKELRAALETLAAYVSNPPSGMLPTAVANAVALASQHSTAAEPVPACDECGKTSTPDGMWALYCVECIGTKIGPALFPEAAECDLPVLGWRCTRAAGHEGPCAAVEDTRTVSEQPPHFARGYATGYADGLKDAKLAPSAQAKGAEEPDTEEVTDEDIELAAASLDSYAKELHATTSQAAERSLTSEEHQVIRAAVRDSAEVVAPGCKGLCGCVEGRKP